MFTPKETFNSQEAEIGHIAKESQRSYILQEGGTKTIEEATRKSIEDYAKVEAKDFLHETRALPTHEAERIVLRLRPETHDQKIEELFGLMVEKGIKNALDIAKKMADPHLEDDFHRFLVQYLHTIGAIPGLKEKDELFKQLNHTLFSVALPPETEESDFKKKVSAMSQFYTSLISLVGIENTISIEIAVEQKTKNINIFIAVPRTSIDGFEKFVHSFFPGSAVEEVVDDFNIFGEKTSAVSISLAKLKEDAYKPLKTYTDFENDPFSATLGALSQIAETGEGCAVQIVLSESLKHIAERNNHILAEAHSGAGKVKDLYKNATEGIGKGLAKEVFSLFKKAKEEKPDEDKKIDTEGIELLKKKNDSRIVEASLRIIASSSDISRAREIRSAIEAGFGQYNYVGGNSLQWQEAVGTNVLEECKAFSFRTHSSNKMELSLNEVSSLVHFPTGTKGPSELQSNDSASAPAPLGASKKTEGVYLGTNTFRGQTSDVFLAKEDRVRHCYVVGQTGTGKTTILKNMAIQDIQNGNGICFIDPHGNDIEDILANIPPERVDDVIYFDPAYTARPMGLNMLEYDINYPEQKIFVINELLSIFNKLFDMKTAGGPAFEQYFRNSAGLVMEDPESGSTLLEISRVMSDKSFRALKLSRCKNPIIKQFWENAEKTTGEASLANFVPYITNKFDPFVSNDIMRPVIAQQHSVLNFREIMDGRKILLVNLSKGRLGDINSHLIGLLLVGKITMAALSRVDIVGKENVNDFYLYIDEFQNVTTDSIATILSEARKYRLALTVAHQYIEQLEEKIKNAVFGNVGNMIIYRVSPENASVFEKQLAPTFTPDDVLKLQNFNAYAKILVGGVPEKPFNLRIPPPPKGNMAISDKIKELSYLKYGRPREEVETEIMARYRPKEEPAL
ncbi:MAG TPA: TraM recognition domain-containing protein [Candidatus Paceibacterota bacterium]|nr:TraM recognition domain-containing protein [Candidatus Paceibacterota bacterium]